MQQKPIKNTTPPIMSPSQHQHGVMMTLRSLQPNPSPWLDHSPQLVTQFPHHSMEAAQFQPERNNSSLEETTTHLTPSCS